MNTVPYDELKRIFIQCERNIKHSLPNNQEEEITDPVFPSTNKTLIHLPRIDYENSPNKAKRTLQEKLRYKKLSL